jgi:23S rRNA (adenine2503-C2)-methyltransferase
MIIVMLWQKWVQSQGYRPGQALMLWKRLYGNDIWAHHSDQLEGFSSYYFSFITLTQFHCPVLSLNSVSSFNYAIGLNKDFRNMLRENAEFKALSLKQIVTAADGTRKVHGFVSLCSWFA